MIATGKRFRNGSSTLMVIFFVTICSALSMSFVSMTQTNVTMADNHCSMSHAQAAAESGLAYAQALMIGYFSNYEPGTFNGAFSAADYVTILDDFLEHMQTELNGKVATNYQDLPTALTAFTQGGRTGRQVALPAIAVSPGERPEFTVTFRAFDDTPNEWEVLSTGRIGNGADQLDQTVRLHYTLDEDTALPN